MRSYLSVALSWRSYLGVDCEMCVLLSLCVCVCAVWFQCSENLLCDDSYSSVKQWSNPHFFIYKYIRVYINRN